MINKITLKKGVKIIDDSYVIKGSSSNINQTYNYLLSRSFDNFPKIIKEVDDYNYYEYLFDVNEPNEQKVIDLIILISVLHSKTTFYKEVDLDYYKETFENIDKKIDDIYKYYNDLMDNIDNEEYMSPANYLIARNITLIYQSLNYAKENISTWYDMIPDKRKLRVVMTHGNLSLEHYLKSDKPYLISWDKSKIDMPIYDLVSLYKYNYLDFEFSDLFKIYLNKYPLEDEEILLFLILISIPDKIKKASTEYKTVLEVRKLLDYLYKTKKLREEYRIEKKSNKGDKLQE